MYYKLSRFCKIAGIGLLFIILFSFGCQRIPEKKSIEETPLTPPPPKPAIEVRENSAVSAGKLRVQKIDDKRQLCLGIWAHGHVGDYILENDKIRAIVTAPDHEIGGINGGGHIIDLCLKDYLYDYIYAFYSRVNTEEKPDYTYDRVRVKTTGYPENGAALIVSGKSDPGAPQYSIKTEYIIKPESPVLEITTSVTNLTTRTLSNTLLGEIAHWGSCTSFVSKHGVIGRGAREDLTDLDWYAAYFDNFTAGFTQKQGPIQGRFDEYVSNTAYKKASIKPGDSATYTRYLIVSDRNLSKITDFAYKMREKKFGFVAGKVIEPGTNDPVPDVDVRFIISRLGDQMVRSVPYTRVYSDDAGDFEVTLPEGQYFVQSKAFARKTAKNPFSFPIKDGDSYGLEVKASQTSKLKFSCRDRTTGEYLPCKLTMINIPPTPFVNQGPGDDIYARNVYYSATGNETIDVPIGRYKIIFSRGIEYNTYEEQILITYTKENVIKARLEQVMDIPGYISADLGVRTSESYDCYVGTEDRVITSAAEGVELIVTGDSNKATDLSPALEKTGLGRFVKTLIGKKIEFMGENNPGNCLVWPLSSGDSDSSAAQPELEADTPKRLMQTLRSRYPGSLLQLNRALFPMEGYFSQFGYDKEKKPVITDADFSYDFDLLEIWEGKRQGVTMDTLDLAFKTWLGGYSNIMPVGSSFSHMTWGEEVGYPRIYIGSSTDNPSEIDQTEIMGSVKNGNILITNGPFIKFTVNGMPPGSLVTDTDGSVDCHMEVFAAPWIGTSHIDVDIDGVFLRRIIQPPTKEVVRYPRKSSPEGGENFSLKIKKDSILTVEVLGSARDDLSPVVPPHPFQSSGMKVFAVTAPVFIDFDGNGRYDPPPEDLIGM